MSLSKQLLILISALFLLIFGVNLILSINNTRTYLETESQSHAQDTATSLGLSLSPYMKNPSDPTIKAMISAIFDMGYYGEIRLLDASGKELIGLANDKKAEGVPAWFIDYLPLSPAVASSEISSGWTISGVVYVTVNPAFGYSSLYRQTQTALYYSLMVLAISMLLLLLLLRMTLASLKRLDQLAQQIADGHFETITPLPWTSEVKSVATSMNIMSQKIKGTISALNSKLEMTAGKLLRDELTGLYKKSVFETDMNHLIMEHGDAFLQIIKLDSLPELVKERGSDAIDELLQKVAGLLRKQAQTYPSSAIKAYRFYGGEFALLIETTDMAQIEAICQSLSDDFTELGKHFGKPDLAHIGIAPVNLVDTPERTLIAAQEAYEQARLIGANSYHIRAERRYARDISAWKALVFDCIDHARYTLIYRGKTHAYQRHDVIMEEAVLQVRDAEGELVAIAPFISIAEKYAKIVDLDKGVVQQVLEHIRTSGIQHAIAVNLSTRSIKNAEFMSWLATLLKSSPVAARQLVFSFSAYAVCKDTDTYVSFFYSLHQWGGRVMIKRFEPQSMPLEINQQLKPDFVRLARDIGNGVSQSHKKLTFAHTLQEMCRLMDIAVLAESIQSDQDNQALNNIGIVGASRQ